MVRFSNKPERDPLEDWNFTKLFLAWTEFAILWYHLTHALGLIVSAYSSVADPDLVKFSQRLLGFLRKVSPFVIAFLVFLLLIDFKLMAEKIYGGEVTDCSSDETVSGDLGDVVGVGMAGGTAVASTTADVAGTTVQVTADATGDDLSGGDLSSGANYSDIASDMEWVGDGSYSGTAPEPMPVYLFWCATDSWVIPKQTKTMYILLWTSIYYVTSFSRIVPEAEEHHAARSKLLREKYDFKIDPKVISKIADLLITLSNFSLLLLLRYLKNIDFWKLQLITSIKR
jgi:hypothetical protein